MKEEMIKLELRKDVDVSFEGCITKGVQINDDMYLIEISKGTFATAMEIKINDDVCYLVSVTYISGKLLLIVDWV